MDETVISMEGYDDIRKSEEKVVKGVDLRSNTVRLVSPSTPNLSSSSTFETFSKDCSPPPFPAVTLQYQPLDTHVQSRSFVSSATSFSDSSSSIASTSEEIPHADMLLTPPPERVILGSHQGSSSSRSNESSRYNKISPLRSGLIEANRKSPLTTPTSSRNQEATTIVVSQPTSLINSTTQYSKKPLHIQIRKARLSDIPRMAEILTQSFWNESAIGQFMHPMRQQYPRDFYRYWRRRVARGMCDWHREMYVAIIDSRVDTSHIRGLNKNLGGNKNQFARQTKRKRESERIVGVVDWADYPSISAKRGVKWLFQIPLAILSSCISHLHFPDRAASRPARLRAYNQAYPYFIHPLVAGTPSRAACIALDLLAVDPEYQSQGIGRTLVEMGLEIAGGQGRGVSVVSAEGKEAFYASCGFKETVGKITETKSSMRRNPLEGVGGGEVLFWWPERGRSQARNGK